MCISMADASAEDLAVIAAGMSVPAATDHDSSAEEWGAADEPARAGQPS
jgi:hypothetical protein